MVTEPAFVAAVVIMLAAGFGLGFALLRAARYPHPTSLVTALSLLTLIALVGMGISTDQQSQAYAQLAAVGLGALVGAVNSVYGNNGDKHKKGEDDDSNTD